jgi:hypothetical protein
VPPVAAAVAAAAAVVVVAAMVVVECRVAGDRSTFPTFVLTLPLFLADGLGDNPFIDS